MTLAVSDRTRAISIATDQLKAFYDSRYSDMEYDCDSLVSIVGAELKRNGISGFEVSAKPKQLHSALEKVQRKCLSLDSDYAERVLAGESVQLVVTDLVRARISCKFFDEIDTIASILDLRFRVSPIHCVDLRFPTAVNTFGYAAVHRIYLPDGDAGVRNFFSGCYSEIQIRSRLMDHWSVVNWDVEYKPQFEVPYEIRRRLSSIAALFYLIDREFADIRDSTLSSAKLLPTPINKDDNWWEPIAETLLAFSNRGLVIDPLDLIGARQVALSLKENPGLMGKDLQPNDLDALTFYLLDRTRFVWMTNQWLRELADVVDIKL